MGFSRKEVAILLANAERARAGLPPTPPPAVRAVRGKGLIGRKKAAFRMERTADGGLKFEVPIYTTTESNTGGSHFAKARRAAKQREALGWFLVGRELPPMPAQIRFTRLGPGKLDGDNLQSSMKHIRDAIAERFGVDDGSDQYEWCYAQERKDFYGVRIEIESLVKS